MTVFECVAGILVSVKTRAHQKIHKLKESYDHLVQRVTELQERSDKLVIPDDGFTLNTNSLTVYHNSGFIFVVLAISVMMTLYSPK